jgi:hypothetical protein
MKDWLSIIITAAIIVGMVVSVATVGIIKTLLGIALLTIAMPIIWFLYMLVWITVRTFRGK